MSEQQPIPKYGRVQCPTCKRTGVAEVGAKIMCETCVNTFLAKNVGLMQPIPDEPESEKLPWREPEFIPEQY